MISNSRSEHASSSGLIKGHQASEQVFCPYHDSYHGIELQVPPTPQLVKRGVDLLIQALWKQG